MKKLLVLTILLVTPAYAQQPDPALLQRVIPQLQQQRNEALDRAALAEAKAAELAEQVAKLKAAADKEPKESPTK